MESQEWRVESGESESPGEHGTSSRPRPLQFRLRSMLLATAALGLLFATLRWLGVPPQASLIVLVVLSVSVPAALVLVAVIAGSLTGENDGRRP